MAATPARRGCRNAGVAPWSTSAATSRRRRPLAPNPLEPRAEASQHLVLRKAGLLRRARQIIVDLDPVAFLDVLGRVANDGDEVHRNAAQHRERIFARECASMRGEAAEIAVGIADVEDRGFGVRL